MTLQLICCIILCGSQLTFAAPSSKQHETLNRRISDSADRLANELDVDINFNTSFFLQLKLKRRQYHIEHASVIEQDSSKPVEATQFIQVEETASYSDEDHNALFTVTQEATSNQLLYFGSFVLGNDFYELMPLNYNLIAAGDEAEKEWNVTLDGRAYRVYIPKTHNNRFYGNDALIPPPYEEMSSEININEETPQENKQKRIKRQTKKILLTPEVLLVFDNSIYERWYNFTKKNEDLAICHLLYYYSHIMNQVSENYQKLEHRAFSMSVSTVAYYIPKTKSDSSYNVVTKEQLDVDKTFASLKSWLQKNKNAKKFPDYDLALLISMSWFNILGVAYIKGICGLSSMAIVKVNDVQDFTATITHEIAHLLGAEHDSEQNTCPNDARFFMSTTIQSNYNEQPTIRTFSQCTIDQFVKHFGALDAANKNCLVNRSSTEVLEPGTHLTTKFGQKFSLDEQCRVFLGEKSHFCGASTMGDIFCNSLYCFYATIDACLMTTSLRVMDGTSCGDKQWCSKGYCVADDNAPNFEVKECPFGDFRDTLNYHFIETGVKQKVPFICNELSVDLYKVCYSDLIALFCCKSCKELRNAYKPDCEFGDKIFQCENNKLLDPEYCNDEENKKKCCSSCS